MRARRTRFVLIAAATVAAVVAGTVPTAFAAKTTSKRQRPPADYIAMADELSQPIYPQTVREAVRIDAFDGKDLYLEIVRPDPELYGDGPWPVILEASPYHGTLADRAGTRMFPDPVDENGTKIGLTGYFPPRGYAVVMFDLRGTGRSQGCLDHIGSNDSKDLSTVIEWAASQAWSNGRVGMTGHSYVGSTPAAAAALPPEDREGLVTIVPSAGLASMYDHQFNKGVPWLLQWAGPMFAYEVLAMDRDLPPIGPDPVQGGQTGDNFANAPNPEFGCGWQNSSLVSGPNQVTGQYGAWHAARDWRAGAAAANIPIFMIHGVNDNAARIPSAEWFFEDRAELFGGKLPPGDKVWIGQWDHGSTNGRCGNFYGFRALHPTCRFDQMKYAIHAWFDKHLKGMDVDTGPPVEAFLNGETPVNVSQILFPETVDGPVFTSAAWHRPSVVTALYPDATTNAPGTTDMSLGFAAPAQNGSRTFRTVGEAVLNSSISRGRATFRSAPLKANTLVLGLPQLELNASVTNPYTHLTATLFRETVTRNEEGALVTQAREPMNFCAIQPLVRNGVETLSPVTPRQEMTLPMQCFTMAHWVPRGQRLALEISTGSQHHATFGAPLDVTVFTGPEKTRYDLPTVRAARLWEDVPLLESYPVEPPTGPAQPGVQGDVITPLPGALVTRAEPVFAAGLEFDVQESFDNAQIKVEAVPTLPGDIDIFLQFRTDSGWQQATAATSDPTAFDDDPTVLLDHPEQYTERLEVGRVPAGQWRVLVHNWGGPPNSTEVTVEFFNRVGESGGFGGEAQSSQGIVVTEASYGGLLEP